MPEKWMSPIGDLQQSLENGNGVVKQESKPMNNQDTITTLIAFLLLLPWLVRVLASGKSIWRALRENQRMRGRKNASLVADT
jgi:hypothetical protein